MAYQLPLEITREEKLWMARSTAIQGFLATGETLDDLFREVPQVVQALYEACRLQGWTFVKNAPDTELRTVVPNHAAREIPTGTLRAILRDLGLTLDDLNQA